MTTPGPWAVSPTKHRTLIVSAHGFHVAALDDASPDDAALMAAAPAMLAALKTLQTMGLGREAYAICTAVISQAQQGQQTNEV